MNTSQWITLFQQRLGESLSRAGILAELNAIQNTILGQQDFNLCKSKGENILATSEGTYDYTFDTATDGRSVRRVAEIWYWSTSSSGYGGYGTSYSALDCGFGADYQKHPQEPKYYVNFQGTDSLSAGDAKCKISFQSDADPGATTDKFILEQYVWPEQLVSENVAFTIPDGFVNDLLFFALKKSVEEQQYGADLYNYPQYKVAFSKFAKYDTGTGKYIDYSTVPRIV